MKCALHGGPYDGELMMISDSKKGDALMLWEKTNHGPPENPVWEYTNSRVIYEPDEILQQEYFYTMKIK